MTGIETVVGVAAAGAAITVGYDVFCKITKAIAGKVNARKLKKIQSEAYQELLKGDATDLPKVEAILSQLSSKDDTSKDTARLRDLYSKTVRSVGKKLAAGQFTVKKAACKKPAAKKAAAKKPAARKVAAKKSSARKYAKRKPSAKARVIK